MARTAKKKRGRPKGSRNKKSLREAIITATTHGLNVGDKVTFNYSTPKGWKPQKFTGMETINLPTEPPSYLSRLEAATVKYEQAINDAITALKGS